MLSAVGSALLIAGCGGGGDSGPSGITPPPVITPVIGPPASVTVAAGDAQLGEPLAALANPVVALVRDSASKPVSNVALAVAVDSGGGTVTTATAVTGPDGRATITGWRLGPTEGPQTLRITTGALVTTARAAAQVPATTIPVLTVPAGGGTVVVTRPGSQLDSTVFTIPAGAYTTAKAVNVSYASSAALTTVAGGRVISPLVTVSGLEARAGVDLRLSIPIRLRAGFTPIVIVKNPTTSDVSTLDLRDFNSTRVTVAFRALNGAAIDNSALTIPPLGAGAPAVRARSTSAVVADAPAQLYVIEIPDAEIFKDRLTEFKLDEDAWNFKAMPTVVEPATQFGMVASALFFFNRSKSAGRPSLKQLQYFNEDPSWKVPYSSWRAMRLVSFASAPAIVGRADRFAPVASQALDADFRAIAANMLISGNKPVPVWATNDAGDIAPLIAIAIVNGQILVYDPMVGESTSGVLIFTPDHRLSFYDQNGSSTPKRYTRVIPVSPYNFYDAITLEPILKGVSTPSYGDDRFPATRLRSAFDTVGRGTDSVFFIDTLSMWITCDACTGKGVTPTFNPKPAPANGEVMLSWLWRRALGTDPVPDYVSITGTEVSNLRGGFRLNANLGPTRLNSLHFIAVGNCGSYACWIDARPATLVFRTTTTLTAPTTVAARSNVSMSVALTRHPSGAIVEWDFDDGTPRQKTGTTLNTTHVYERDGTYRIKVRTYHPRTEQLVGIDSNTVEVTGRSWAAWRFTSFQISVDDQYRGLPYSGGTGPATRWSVYRTNATSSPSATQFLAKVLADSIDWYGIAAGSKPGALVYLSKDTVSRNRQDGTTVYRAAKGLHYLVDVQVPTADLVMPYGLDPYSKALASPTLQGVEYPTAIANACKSAFSNFYTSAGNPLSTASSTASGSVWAHLIQTDGVGGSVTNEPRRVTTAQVSFNGETATGTLRVRYRLNPSCGLSDGDETPWTITANFNAVRIR
ncbi:PKD domain-containing protein [Gemmatimonas groenlandica]|uniref:PKD domain-containing protein n=1 Tax=Gemmatimonas groenlandica TaxID=2732249 RepID=A0A6M4IT96_9BACT|nr:PKD domain-containing protein [Gemmatimonas groenlandica]QJR36757.1 hypothetical protein HKW67_15160 [Gemmatimonas groenlandica]